MILIQRTCSRPQRICLRSVMMTDALRNHAFGPGQFETALRQVLARRDNLA